MSNTREAILHIPQSIREDTLKYRGGVKKYIDGDTSAIAFRAYRVPMGVYEQRTKGRFMVRIRIGAGQVLPAQLERIAQLSKNYGNGILHITTRQDIQIHEVNIENTPDVLESLLEVGLSPRGGGGNTVRNVTACPEAGLCPKEEFDVAPYSVATAEYLLQNRSSFNLPRKFKIVFSGCSEDCAYASVADLGFFAHIKDGVKGFAAYAGGGLGPNPAVGVKVEDFVPAEEIFTVAEAVKRLFDAHGDRTNKHKARLRYVLKRLGEEEFVKLYQQQRDAIRTEGLFDAVPRIRDITADYPVKPDSVTVRLRLINGDMTADDMVKVGQIASRYGQGIIRTTQQQDILITGVAKDDLDMVNTQLKSLSVDSLANGRPKLVACTGAATCKLGLCLSRNLSDAIADKLSQTNLPADISDTSIRISGCPNSCANHYIADIGFQGKAKRVNGRLMPCYDILAGAQTIEGNAKLAKKIGTIPAKRIPDFIAKALAAATIEKQQLKALISEYDSFDADSISDDYYIDLGDNKPFSLAGRGPGECGAGVTDVARVDIDEAKDALKAEPITNENIYKAIVASARALLITVGLEPKKDREIFEAFTKHLIEPGWVKASMRQLLADAVDWRMGDTEQIVDLAKDVAELIDRVEQLFLSLDANLKFKIEPLENKADAADDQKTSRSIDLRGVSCPLNFVKAKLALEKIETGGILEVLLDDGEPVRNVPASFAQQGQDVLEVNKVDDHFCLKVRRTK